MRFIFLILLIFSSLSAKSSVDEVNGLKLGMSYEEVIQFADSNDYEVSRDDFDFYDRIFNIDLIEQDDGKIIAVRKDPQDVNPYEYTINLNKDSEKVYSLYFCKDMSKLHGISYEILTNDIRDLTKEIHIYENEGYLIEKNELSILYEIQEVEYSRLSLRLSRNLNDPRITFYLGSNLEERDLLQKIFGDDQKTISISKSIDFEPKDFCN